MPGSSKETLGQKAVARSQRSIRLIKRNDALDGAVRIENANLARAKARTARGVVNRLLLAQEHGLNTGALIHLPAVSISSGGNSYRAREPNAFSNAVDYAKFLSRSHDAVIRVCDQAGNVIETHEYAGQFKEA
jgi:hypothetical protein